MAQLTLRPGGGRGPEIRERLGVDRQTWRRVLEVVEKGPWGPKDRQPVVLMLDPKVAPEAACENSAAVVIRRFAEVLAAVWEGGGALRVYEVSREAKGRVSAGDPVVRGHTLN